MKKLIICLMSLPFLLLLEKPVALAKGDVQNWQDNAVYYILVDRFVNGSSTNDIEVNIDDVDTYHGGDIQGVINKLDYISELGFTAINLSPIMENEQGSFQGFQISDYRVVEEQFGTMEDLKLLVTEAHKRGIEVILDFVITHTASNHPWVNGKNTTDYYMTDRTVQTSIWDQGLPRLNLSNVEVQNYLIDSAEYWMKEAKIDGYRIYIDEQTPEAFIKKLNDRVHLIDANFFTIGDSNNTDDWLNADFDALIDNQLNEQATSIFRAAGNELDPLYQTWKEPNDSIHTGALDDIMTTRFARKSSAEGYNPVTRWKLGLTYLYTINGMPIIYQGSEIPMNNGIDEPDHDMVQFNSGDNQLKNFIEQLNAIRKKFPALSKGKIELIGENGAMSVYKRSHQGQIMYVAINNGEETLTISTDNVPSGMQLTGLLQDDIVRERKDGTYKITLDRETSDIYMVEEDKGLNWLFISFIIVVIGGFVLAIMFMTRKNNQED
ncbi:alpha-amylase family glycosyl hydrolase [Radiobacillus sp. PE A8.2]|uniref:alpha-amylase family glycosyl hydrolase n=1 Tax=Radiobacillus sp. PE A8.2 TaxID=3380349 RepID=UPI00388F1785